MEQEELDGFDSTEEMAQEIIALKQKHDALLEEQRAVSLEISRVHIFGDFSLEEILQIEKMGHRKIQFYCAKQGLAETLNLPDEVLYVGSDHGLDYFVAINQTAKQYPKLIGMTIEHPWGQLKQKNSILKKEIHENDRKLKKLAKYNHFLHHALIHHLNEFYLGQAKKTIDFPLEKANFFVVQGWVPIHKLEQLHILVKEMKVYFEEIAIDSKDVIPTYLENEGAGRIGEDLVHIYDTPSNADKDPSLWVLVFFSLFFAMIIGDGGYGLVLLLIALYIRYKHSKIQGVKKRILDLFTILAFSCIAWGVLTTSFFGIPIAPNSPIRKISVMSWLVEKKAEYHLQHKDEVYKEWVKINPKLKDVSNADQFLLQASHVNHNGKTIYDAYNKFNDNIMLELALFIGVIRIILSMGRYINRNWSFVGWIIFLIGAYLYTPTFLGLPSS